jgi:hypothetical protein
LRYYKKYYNRNSYYNHTFYSQYDDSKVFVKNELFKLDKTSINKLLAKYKNEFGYKAYDYFIEAFDKWKSGRVRISDQTVDRIIKYVPSLLSIDKQYELIKLEIINSLKIKTKTLLNHYGGKQISFKEYNEKLIQYINEIYNYKKDNIRWFIKKVFNDEDINKFLCIYKNLLIIKIKYTYYSIKSDLNLLFNYLNSFNNVYAEALYTPNIIGFSINLFQNKEFSFNIDFDSYISNIHLNNIDSVHYKSIEKEIIEISIFKDSAQSNLLMNDNNLKLLVESYNKLKVSSKDFFIKQTFLGNGGKFFINIENVSVPKLRIRKYLHISYISINLLAIIIFSVLYFLNVKNVCNGLTFLLAIVISVITFNHLSFQIEKVKFFNNQINKYVRN